MNHIRIVKNLAIAAISSLTLMAGASQASEWGHFQRAYAPGYSDRSSFEHDLGDRDARRHHDSESSIDLRQQRQMEKIMQGLRTGSLSRREARNLMQEQREIEQLQRHYLADRHLSRSEWLDLDRRLDLAARDIRAEKRDGDWR